MKQISLFVCFATLLLVSCKKEITEDVAPVVGKARLEISPATASTTIGGTATFTLKYYNEQEQLAQVPAGLVWESANVAIATVSQSGVATGVSGGQVQIRAKVAGLEATSLLTVVTNNSQVATITITPTTKELTLNSTTTPTAVAKTNDGTTITGKTFTWQSANTAIAEVNASTGVVTAKGYGTTTITATVDGIQSAPAEIQVIRVGTFTGNSFGTVKLKIENGVLKMQTNSDFGGSSAPDLRMYLSNSGNGNTNALEIATLTQRAGAQSWNIPSNVNITSYRYVVVWCKQFSANYGTADLGQ
jgi:Tfp pilus assembly protein PilP